ncbi:MAG: hypothetical protein EOO06_20995 [Chitinophagaceae bacterium]|nr:MAG: hypothetical protein EOO06_20995 [Chitinophagaceae bacterium]
MVILFSCKQSEESLFEQALHYDQKKSYREAINFYSEVLERNPKNELALYNRSWCWYLLDSNRLALADLEMLIRSKPTTTIEYKSNPLWNKDKSRWTVFTSEALFQRGVVKFDMDSLKGAYADFKACAESGHEVSESFLYMGRIMAMYGKKDKACEYLKEALLQGNTKAREVIGKVCP